MFCLSIAWSFESWGDRSIWTDKHQTTDRFTYFLSFLPLDSLWVFARTDRAGVCWDLRSLHRFHARETRYSERDTRRECKWFLCVYIAANDWNMWTKRRHWVINFTVSTALNSSRLNRTCSTRNHFPLFILYLPLARSTSRCSFSGVIYSRRSWWVSCFKAIRAESADRVQSVTREMTSVCSVGLSWTIGSAESEPVLTCTYYLHFSCQVSVFTAK